MYPSSINMKDFYGSFLFGIMDAPIIALLLGPDSDFRDCCIFFSYVGVDVLLARGRIQSIEPQSSLVTLSANFPREAPS